MTQEQKELLFKDLCGRLPYGVKVKFYDHWVDEYEIIPLTAKLLSDTVYIGDIKPYLFPLSSMTEAQCDELYNISTLRLAFTPDRVIDIYTKTTEWLLKNHIDYKDLIGKGLALDATGKNIY